MSHWEASGASDEWYTPKYIFTALGCRFDQDVAAPYDGPRHVPTDEWLYTQSLESRWHGFVWMNPPFGGRNGLEPWLDKFFAHGHGIALTPDRTSTPWWHRAAARAQGVLFIQGKIKFHRPDGTLGKSPSSGTCLFAAGTPALCALARAERAGLGLLFSRPETTA